MSVFSPLALTQALPFLPLAQGDIDYEVSRRDEPDLFDTAKHFVFVSSLFTHRLTGRLS